jgi:hypothetical protein
LKEANEQYKESCPRKPKQVERIKLDVPVRYDDPDYQPNEMRETSLPEDVKEFKRMQGYEWVPLAKRKPSD